MNQKINNNMITKYDEFLLEKMITMINESEVIYSPKFRKLIKSIKSPVSAALNEIENKDVDVSNNYFDIADDKDKISFITDRKAKELLASAENLVTYNGGAFLTNNIHSNGTIFNLLGYDPNTNGSYTPDSGEKAEIVSKAAGTNGVIYARIKFENGQERVIREERLGPSQAEKELWSKYRQSIRTGRGIKALLNSYGKKFTDAEIEDFVNKYKSAFDRMNDVFNSFELVSGEDIAKWYNYRNYEHRQDKGTLGNSCMSDVDSDYFDIYCENKCCSLLILKTEDETKIKGRALVWKLSYPDKVIFMDRVYTHDDSDVQLFRDYAKSKGWCAKIKNDSSPDSTVYDPQGQKVDYKVLSVNVGTGEYDNYPYVDTLKYYYVSKGILSTEHARGCLTLEDTGGGGYDGDEDDCYECGGNGRITCPECDGSGNETCPECDGEGKIECVDCNGMGEVKCINCDGEGKEECPTCDGSGEVDGETCTDCDGDGEVDCESCDGKGMETCSTCDGTGKDECSECSGSGEIECEECDGEGRIDCPECS